MGKKATPALLVALGLLFAAEFCFSLRWRMEHDSPILLYLAWLIDRRHFVPYRDVFDMNTPATYAVYALVGRTFGYGDLGFRAADLTMLTAILATMWFWMRRFGAACAWCAALCFGLLFLRLGVTGGLQRDFVLILPVSAAVLIAAARWRRAPSAFAIGLLFGIAGAIKPQAAIGLAVVVGFCLRRSDPSGKPRVGWPVLACISVAGFALPLAATYLCLLQVGALGSFLDIARGYWPLYGRLASNTHAVAGPAGVVVRGLFLLQGIASFGPYAAWSLAAVAGVLAISARTDVPEPNARFARLLGAVAAAYAIYPAFAGQFWDYHWLPFTFFAVAAGSLCLVAHTDTRNMADRLPALMLVMAVLITIRPPAVFLDQVTGRGANIPKHGRVDAIASYLKTHLKPGDTVQPLDWTGGAVHAMLIARAMPATRFIYDFHFYHSVSEPYIQGLRKEFVARLAASRPRFIVEIVGPEKPWVSGPDTTRSFPALRRLIRSTYAPVERGSGYVIYEIRH
jgi:hypothetical protein